LYQAPDWLEKPLSELTQKQWETLCDGCGKCCMAKLQDVDTDEVFYTNVACELFDSETCRCSDYVNRTSKVSNCISLSLDRTEEFEWLPLTCAYRLRHEMKPLPEWHPLITGDSESTQKLGHSVKNRTIQSKDADALEFHIVDWSD